MSENEKDDKNFEFIKEQVIEKKRKKLRKRLKPLFMTIGLAILFGTIAAVTFVIVEPRLHKLLHKEEETKTPVSFPTEYPEDPVVEITPTVAVVSPDQTTVKDPGKEETEPETVIVEKSIDADVEDFISIYDEIRTVAYNANKSVVKVNSTATVKDWFGDTVERTIHTTGLIIANDNVNLLILVSLDRIKDASNIQIDLSDTKAVNAVLQDYESELNLAVVAVPLEDIPPAFMGNLEVATLGESYTVTQGSPILALGSPNGHPSSMELGFITSRGSWVTITDNKLDLFNTDIEDNENSDGIIMNLNGEVIGIITRTLKDDLSENLSTVIGISKVKPYIEQMANMTPRVYFGVKTEDMTEAVKLEHLITKGIYVNEVMTDSPAFAAGMKNGDIILDIDDISIMNTSNFYNTIGMKKPGDEILVKIKRTAGTTDKEMDLTIVLEGKEK